jgi:hypothetical protein
MADINKVVNLFKSDEKTLPYFELLNRAIYDNIPKQEFNSIMVAAESEKIITQTEDLGGYFYTLNDSNDVQEV